MLTQEPAQGSGQIDDEVSDAADVLMGDDCRQTQLACLIERRGDL